MSKRGRTFRHVRPRSFFKRYFYPVPKWQTAWLLVLRFLVGAWLGRRLRCRCRLRLRRRLGLRCRLRLGRRFRLGRGSGCRCRLRLGLGLRCGLGIRSAVTRSSGLLLEGQYKSQDVVLILIGPLACIACGPIANGTVLEHLAKDRKKYGDEATSTKNSASVTPPPVTIASIPVGR